MHSPVQCSMVTSVVLRALFALKTRWGGLRTDFLSSTAVLTLAMFFWTCERGRCWCKAQAVINAAILCYRAPWSRGPLVKSLQQSSFLGLPASDIVCRLGVTSFPPVTGMQDWTCLSFHLSLTFSCLDECSRHSPIALREEMSNATPSAGNTRGYCPHGLLMWGKLKPPRACRHFMRSFCVSPVKFDAVLHTLNSSHNTV